VNNGICKTPIHHIEGLNINHVNIFMIPNRNPTYDITLKVGIFTLGKQRVRIAIITGVIIQYVSMDSFVKKYNGLKSGFALISIGIQNASNANGITHHFHNG